MRDALLMIGKPWTKPAARFGEAHLGGVLKAYALYYNEVRSHLSLDKEAPVFDERRKIGRIAAIPILGGFHHQSSGFRF